MHPRPWYCSGDVSWPRWGTSVRWPERALLGTGVSWKWREGEWVQRSSSKCKQLFPSVEPSSFPCRRPLSALRRMDLEQRAKEKTPIQQIEAMWQQITYMSLLSDVILTTSPPFYQFPYRAAKISKPDHQTLSIGSAQSQYISQWEFTFVEWCFFFFFN